MTKYARPPGPYGTSIKLNPSAFPLTHATVAHTFGDWTEVVTAAEVVRDVMGFWIMQDSDYGGSNLQRQLLMEIGLGGSGTSVDKTIMTGLPWSGSNVNNRIYLPLHVPAGLRICLRVQGTTVNSGPRYDYLLDYAPGPPMWGGFSMGEGLNVDAATSHFNHGDLTDNAWEEIVASTSVDYKGLSYVPAQQGTAMINAVTAVDLGVGAASSEQLLATYLVRTTNNDEIHKWCGPWFIDHPIPAGLRLALRKNGTADLSGTIIGWR